MAYALIKVNIMRERKSKRYRTFAVISFISMGIAYLMKWVEREKYYTLSKNYVLRKLQRSKRQ